MVTASMAIMVRRPLRASPIVGVVSLVTGLLCISTASGFHPFADVPELGVSRLHEHCDAKDKITGLANCRRWIKKRLEDESDVDFSWEMKIDPDRVLSLDTERPHGVKFLRCDEDSVELELPPAYVGHAAKDNLIVGSKFVHRCRHWRGKHMFRKVIQVKKLTRDDSGTTRVHLLTKNLPGIAHAIPSLRFNLSYMPAEARDTHLSFPPMRTKRHARRLSDQFDTDVNLGDFNENSPKDNLDVDTMNNLLDLNDDQLSNFGWNWNFFMNSTQEPEFNLTIPGMNGYMKLKHPYIKVHAGIYLNFTSSSFGDTLDKGRPIINWVAGVLAHGDVNARMMTEMQTTGAASEDAFHLMDIPVLEKLEKTTWLEPMNVAMGTMPFSVEPGFQMKGEMYHTGQFDGTLQLGGKTHFVTKPQVKFDSESANALAETFVADFQDTTMYPPLWIIQTKYFEMGFMFEPTFWVKGDLGMASQDTKAGLEARPYLNLTIQRESSTAVVGDDLRTLICYPFRVTGLGAVHFTQKYQVQVKANGATMTSTPELNYGEVEIHDHMQQFNAGSIPQTAVLTNEVEVTLQEVNSATGQTIDLGSAKVQCETLLNGECQPTPLIASMEVQGQPVRVELIMLWMDNPVPWFASRIRGIGLSIPQIGNWNLDVINQGSPALASLLQAPAIGGRRLTDVSAEKLFLRLTHANKTYVTEVQLSSTANGVSASTGAPTKEGSGSSVIEMGPQLIESWIPCDKPDCQTAKLELYYGTTLIGHAPMPEIPWNEVSSLATEDTTVSASSLGGGGVGAGAATATDPLQSMLAGSATASSVGGMANPMAMMQSMIGAGGQAMAQQQYDSISLDVSLMSPSGAGAVGVLKTLVSVLPPAQGSSFLQPETMSEVTLGSSETLIWTVAYVVETKTYDFRITPMKAVDASTIAQGASVSYPSIGNKVLQPITTPGVQQEKKATCTVSRISGVEEGSEPCSFQHLISFTAGTFAVNDRIVLMVEWIDDNLDHVMYSPPILVVNGGRRMNEKPKAKPRQLWTAEDWNERLAANEMSCKDQDLHFQIGTGTLVRAKMVDTGMPMMPMMQSAGDAENPNMMSTGFQRMGKQENVVDSDADKLLPSEMCADGVCNGKMPGCTEANFQTMYFPTLVFNFNRDLTFKEVANAIDLATPVPVDNKTVRTALAYAFSSLPEAVEVFLQQLNESNDTTTASPYGIQQWHGQGMGTPSPRAYGGASVYPTALPAINPYTGAAITTLVPPTVASVTAAPTIPSVTAAPVGTTPLVLPTNAPIGGRRLRATPEVEEEQEQRPKRRRFSRRVTMRFKKGVHYIIDRPLVEMMMRHGMFQDVEDELSREGHGNAYITSFEVYSDSEGKVGALDDSKNRAMKRPWFYKYYTNKELSALHRGRHGFGLAALACVAAVAAAVSLVVMRSKVCVRGWYQDLSVGDDEPARHPQANNALE